MKAGFCAGVVAPNGAGGTEWVCAIQLATLRCGHADSDLISAPSIVSPRQGMQPVLFRYFCGAVPHANVPEGDPPNYSSSSSSHLFAQVRDEAVFTGALGRFGSFALSNPIFWDL